MNYSPKFYVLSHVLAFKKNGGTMGTCFSMSNGLANSLYRFFFIKFVITNLKFFIKNLKIPYTELTCA